MKRFFPVIVFGFALLWLASSLLPPRTATDDVDLVTVRKNSGAGRRPRSSRSTRLRAIRSSLFTANKRCVSPMENRSARCNGSPMFSSTRPWPMNIRCSSSRTPKCSVCSAGNRAIGKYFSFAELTPFLKQIDEQGEQSDKLQSVAAFGLSKRDLESAQCAGPLSATEEQRAAGGRAEFRDRTGAFESAIARGGKSGAAARNRRKFRQSEAR